LEADHTVESATRQQFHGARGELRGQKTVERRGRAPALEMTENRMAQFSAWTFTGAASKLGVVSRKS
jgi:hypothetical protein